MAFPPQPIQGSYRFLDPKFKTFSSLFSKTIIYFARLKSYQKGDRKIFGGGTGWSQPPATHTPFSRLPYFLSLCLPTPAFSDTDETLTRLTQSTHVYMCHVMTRMM